MKEGERRRRKGRGKGRRRERRRGSGGGGGEEEEEIKIIKSENHKFLLLCEMLVFNTLIHIKTFAKTIFRQPTMHQTT